MTHIEQMIKDLCPNGVEWKTFDKLGVFYGGLSGKTKDDFKDGNAKFITYLNIANNPALHLDIEDTVQIGPNEKQNLIQYGDALFTGSSETPDECAMSSVVTEYPTENLYLNSFCFGFRFNSLDGIDPAFYKHYFRSNHFRQAVRRTANGTTRFNVSKKEFAKLEIPLPPLEIQKKIVECLDKFAALAAELQAELQAELHKRCQQYEYYRTRLLTPPQTISPDASTDECKWEWKTLGEVCEIRGRIGFRGYTRQDQVAKGEGAISLSPGNIQNGIMNYDSCTYITWQKYEESPEIMVDEGDIIFCKTASVGKTAFISQLPEKATINPQLVLLKNIKFNNRYLSYYLQTESVQNAVKQMQGLGSVPNVSQANLAQIRIALPPLAEQGRIVAILDKFEALTTSLSEGIPAEQAAQQKRYEYYRDRLLNFERKQ